MKQQKSRKDLRRQKKQEKQKRKQSHQSHVSSYRTNKFITSHKNKNTVNNNRATQRHNKISNKINNEQNKQQQWVNKDQLQQQYSDESQMIDVQNYLQGYQHQQREGFQQQQQLGEQYQQDEFDEQQLNQQQLQQQQEPQYMDMQEQQIQGEQYSEDRDIARLQQKLGMKGKKNNRYQKLAKGLGFDDDLFSFLDNISKKVNTPLKTATNIKTKKAQSNNKSKLSKREKQPKQAKKQKISSKQIYQMPPRAVKKQLMPQQNQQSVLPTTTFTQQISPSTKPLTSLFNKISDGNLTPIFRQFLALFQQYSKAQIYPKFAQLFAKFNLLIEKPLTHIITANVVMAVALTMVYGSRVMAIVIRQMTVKYKQLQEQPEDEEEIAQIGYSKVFQKKKNYYAIVCYFYQFGAISAEFIHSLIESLVNTTQNSVYSRQFLQNIEFIYIIIQKSGQKLRNNDTTVLKQILQILKNFIQQAKTNESLLKQNSKIKFIQIEINQIRYNRKSADVFDADQRMGFLHTFLNKIVDKQAPVIQNKQYMMLLTYQQIANADVTVPLWWEYNQNNNGTKADQNQQKNNIMMFQSEQIKQLKQLAKSYHFVTEIRRNIFVELMSAKDYIEATRKILDMRVRRLQQVAIVLSQTSLQQPDSFNPFYVLVAAKLCAQIPKLRVSLQFAIWDRIKQLESFDARKISNHGKFFGWLLASDCANCSLSMLKFFTDLSNLKPHEQVFTKVVFKQLFRKSKRQNIAKLVLKLNQQKNRSIRTNIKQYLQQLQINMQQDCAQSSKSMKQKHENQHILNSLKLMKKLINLQEQQQDDMQ